MMGDILSGALRDKGVAGLVCDGAVGDVGIVGNWTDFPVFLRWINPRGPRGAERGAINLPVVIGGCVVAPGDLIIGDDDGLVALSPATVRTAIAAAEAKLAREAVWISALAAGKSVAEVFDLAPTVAPGVLGSRFDQIHSPICLASDIRRRSCPRGPVS